MLTKEATYKDAIQKLLAFREEMFEQITQIVSEYPDEAFAKMPFATCAGDRICPNVKCCREKDLEGKEISEYILSKLAPNASPK